MHLTYSKLIEKSYIYLTNFNLLIILYHMNYAFIGF